MAYKLAFRKPMKIKERFARFPVFQTRLIWAYGDQQGKKIAPGSGA
jgi:hypothetical protein